jgi:transketolase
VEQLAALRAMPGLIVLRPGDANEVSEAWRLIMQLKHDPAVLVLSRQNMPTLDRTRYAPADGLTRGAYVLADAADGDPDVILMGTGTEVGLVVAAYEQLTAEGIKARAVSMPSWELFERQPEEYRDSVLPRHIKARVAVEQAAAFGWHQYVGLDGDVVAMQAFGTSAPLKDVVKKFGFTPEHVVEVARAQVGRSREAR